MEGSMRKKAALHNLGCKVNAYETEAMRQLLEEAGYEIVPFAPGADVYVINTCTVTNIADRKSRQMLHRAKKMNPGAIVVAAGCYVQTAGEAAADPSIDIVLGNNKKKDLVEALRAFIQKRDEEKDTGGTEHTPIETAQEKGWSGSQRRPAAEMTDGKHSEQTAAGNDPDPAVPAEMPESCASPEPEPLIEKIDINHTKEYEQLHIDRTEEHTRAYLKVQDGCNQFCSYCIIPYARGRVRSRGMEDVLEEVRSLAVNGCAEVVLTGIHLSSYGVDLGTTLLELIQAVHEVEGIRRIRLGSLEPGIITEEFVEKIAALPKFCPHFHLSLQSGCTATLKRMNRRYTAEEFREKCALLRRVFERPAITTDVIAGFPGETWEEFLETEAFLTELRLYETHIFKYSRRKGTRADQMPDQVPEQEKNRRSERLIALGDRNRSLFEEEHLGREAEALFEEKIQVEGMTYFTGYTKEYIRVVIPADRDYSNVTVTGILCPGPAPHLYLLQEHGSAQKESVTRGCYCSHQHQTLAV